MRRKLFFAVLTVLLLSCKCHGKTANQCPAQQAIYGKALKGYNFKTLVSSSSFECLVDCHYEDRCQSYNYVIKTNICEMNNRTKEAKPDQFVSDPDRFYMKRGAHRSKVIVIINRNYLWCYLSLNFMVKEPLCILTRTTRLHSLCTSSVMQGNQSKWRRTSGQR